jgi:pilus assembly protein CpaF
MISILENEVWAPLKNLLCNNDVNDIICTSANDIWYYESGDFKKHEIPFASASAYKEFIDIICETLGSDINFEKPFLEGKIENLRVHVAAPCITQSFYHVSIRRHKEEKFSLEQITRSLSSITFLPADLQKTLNYLLKTELNFLVVGPTGCGKTTLMNSLISALPPNERNIILEDSNELQTRGSLDTKLLTRTEQGQLKDVILSDLLKQALRMKPNRLILGEIRGGEAKDLLLALSTGHKGSFGSIHANSAQEALLRLEFLIQMGAPSWSADMIRKLIHLSLQWLIILQNHKGHRHIQGIYRIASLEVTGFLIEPVDVDRI